jgi:hypothetical protein
LPANGGAEQPGDLTRLLRKRNDNPGLSNREETGQHSESLFFDSINSLTMRFYRALHSL